MKLLKVALTLVVVLSFTGCAGTRSLYKQADTPPQYGKVVLMHLNVVGDEIVRVVENKSLPTKTRLDVLIAYRRLVCGRLEELKGTDVSMCEQGPAYILEGAIAAYETLKEAKTEEALQKAIDDAVPLLVELITALDEVKL